MKRTPIIAEMAVIPPQDAADPPRRRRASTGIPDCGWANQRLNIADVARALGCEVFGGRMIRCWRPDRHQHGDRSPSVGIHVKMNRCKCFGNGCDGTYRSVIDLVMDVRQVDLIQAMGWLDSRFEIPRLAKGKRLSEPTRLGYEVGKEGPMELIVRSGVFARLSPCAQRGLPVLLTFAEHDDHRRYGITISYSAMMRHSGIKSRTAIKIAVDCLEAWNLLQRIPGAGEASIFKPISAYFLTPYSEDFQQVANAIYPEHRSAITAERSLRERENAERRKRIARKDQKSIVGY